MLKKLLIYLNIIDEVQVPVPMQWKERTPMERALELSSNEMLKERQRILQEQKREASASLVREKKVTEPILTLRERKTNRSYRNKIKNLAEQAKGIGRKTFLQKGNAADVLHIVDLKNIPHTEKAAFKSNVIDGAGLSTGIVFINQ